MKALIKFKDKGEVFLEKYPYCKLYFHEDNLYLSYLKDDQKEFNRVIEEGEISELKNFNKICINICVLKKRSDIIKCITNTNDIYICDSDTSYSQIPDCSIKELKDSNKDASFIFVNTLPMANEVNSLEDSEKHLVINSKIDKVILPCSFSSVYFRSKCRNRPIEVIQSKSKYTIDHFFSRSNLTFSSYPKINQSITWIRCKERDEKYSLIWDLSNISENSIEKICDYYQNAKNIWVDKLTHSPIHEKDMRDWKPKTETIENISNLIDEYLTELEYALVSASSRYRDAMVVTSVRQQLQLKRSLPAVNKSMQYMSYFLSQFQTSIKRPLIIILIMPIIFNLGRNITFNVPECEEITRRLISLLSNWEFIRVYIIGFEGIISYSRNNLWAALCLAMVSSLIFMIKHAYNRYTNYKW